MSIKGSFLIREEESNFKILYAKKGLAYPPTKWLSKSFLYAVYGKKIKFSVSLFPDNSYSIYTFIS